MTEKRPGPTHSVRLIEVSVTLQERSDCTVKETKLFFFFFCTLILYYTFYFRTALQKIFTSKSFVRIGLKESENNTRLASSTLFDSELHVQENNSFSRVPYVLDAANHDLISHKRLYIPG